MQLHFHLAIYRIEDSVSRLDRYRPFRRLDARLLQDLLGFTSGVHKLLIISFHKWLEIF
jgi:hypothetical protein